MERRKAVSSDHLLLLGLRDILDDEQDYDIYIGKGGPNSDFYHHYIVVESSDLPIRSRRLIFELSKRKDHVGRKKVVPNVRMFSDDGNPDYKITVTTTLRSDYPTLVCKYCICAQGWVLKNSSFQCLYFSYVCLSLYCIIVLCLYRPGTVDSLVAHHPFHTAV